MIYEGNFNIISPIGFYQKTGHYTKKIPSPLKKKSPISYFRKNINLNVMDLNSIMVLLLQPQLRDTNSVTSVAELLMKGGYIMIPIILLSIISIYSFIERYLYIRRSAFIDETMVGNVISEIRNKKVVEAVNHAIYSNSSHH